jgi:hypothetical protein
VAALQVRCIQLAIDNPAPKGEMRVYNQFTEQASDTADGTGKLQLVVVVCVGR